MYVFNIQFFREFYKVIRVKRRCVEEKLAVSSTTYDYWYQAGDLPIVKLVQLSNEFHVPISYFILSEKQKDKSFRSPVIYGRWESITIDLRKMGDDLTDGNTVSKVCEKMGCSSKTFYDVFRVSETPKGLSVNTLLRYINKVHLYPGDYIVDRNQPIVFEDGVYCREVSLERSLHDSRLRIMQLEKEVNNLRSVIQAIRDLASSIPNVKPLPIDTLEHQD